MSTQAITVLMLPSSSEDLAQHAKADAGQCDVSMTQVNMTPLATQVAGHVYNKNNRKMGMLSLGPGIVLKALQDSDRGMRELDFYQRVTSSSCSDRDAIDVRQFLATFHGTVIIDGVKFLKLENVTRAFKKPCIADLKIGLIAYDPFDAPEKVAHQKSKCPSAAILGFQIAGMMVYHPHCGEFEKMDKQVGHKLTTDNMLKEGIGKFFGYPHVLRKDVISKVIPRLHSIEDWFKRQTQYVFYASSLLVVYDGIVQWDGSSSGMSKFSSQSAYPPDICLDPSLENKNFEHVPHPPDPLVDVRMIDFTHVHPSTDIDNNYLAGLRNLIQHLEQLLELDTVSVSRRSANI